MSEHAREFPESENPWSPSAAVAEINERTGAGLALVGLTGLALVGLADQRGGTSSAAHDR